MSKGSIGHTLDGYSIWGRSSSTVCSRFAVTWVTVSMILSLRLFTLNVWNFTKCRSSVERSGNFISAVVVDGVESFFAIFVDGGWFLLAMVGHYGNMDVAVLTKILRFTIS